jgi:hypothetical protein
MDERDATGAVHDDPMTVADVDRRLNASGQRHTSSETDETVTVESARGTISLTRHRATPSFATQHP